RIDDGVGIERLDRVDMQQAAADAVGSQRPRRLERLRRGNAGGRHAEGASAPAALSACVVATPVATSRTSDAPVSPSIMSIALLMAKPRSGLLITGSPPLPRRMEIGCGQRGGGARSE